MAWNSRLIRREQKSLRLFKFLPGATDLHTPRNCIISGIRISQSEDSEADWPRMERQQGKSLWFLNWMLEQHPVQELSTRVLVSYKERFMVLAIYFWTACIFWEDHAKENKTDFQVFQMKTEQVLLPNRHLIIFQVHCYFKIYPMKEQRYGIPYLNMYLLLHCAFNVTQD